MIYAFSSFIMMMQLKKGGFCMKKRIIAGVLALLLLCLCGCKKDTEKATSQPKDDETVVVEEIIVSKNNTTQSKVESKDDKTVVSDGSAVTSTQTSTSQVTSQVESATSKPNDEKKQVEIDYNTVVEIDICEEITRTYLDYTEADKQYYWLTQYGGKTKNYGYQNVVLDWEIDGSLEYTVQFSQNADFSNSFTAKSSVTKEVPTAILVPGETYYWRVFGENSKDAIGGGKIKVVDSPVRWIKVGGVYNVRDMGGWKTESGKTVKYGMLYRGSQLNKVKDGSVINMVSESGLQTLKQLGIKTEFDLRGKSDVQAPPTGINLKHVSVANHTSYHNIFSKNTKDTVVQNYKTIFEQLSNESNYPIYAHCQGGADRTGTYAFLLNGLLGVSYEDLIRDFELTSFCGNQISRWRSAGNGTTFTESDGPLINNTITVSWTELYNGMMDYGKSNGCDTLQESIEHWFINYIGIPQSQIDSFKAIMLE